MLYCVYSVLMRSCVVSCVGSQAVPSIHLAPILGLDYEAGQSEDNDKQVCALA